MFCAYICLLSVPFHVFVPSVNVIWFMNRYLMRSGVTFALLELVEEAAMDSLTTRYIVRLTWTESFSMYRTHGIIAFRCSVMILKFVRKWGSQGSSAGQFLIHPYGIALDSDRGLVYVTLLLFACIPYGWHFCIEVARWRMYDGNCNWHEALLCIYL